MTILALGALVVSTLILPVTALTMRAVTDAISAPAPMTTVIITAVAAAVACAISIGVEDATTLVLRTAGDKLGRLHLHPDVHRTISEMVGIEHLERSDYLDRVVVVRGGTSALASYLWNSAVAAANIVKVVVTAALLATADPVLMLLAVFAAIPGFCYNRGQRAVQQAEIDTAEDFRLQQHLFDTSSDAASLKDILLSGAADQLCARQATTWNRLQRRRIRGQVMSALWVVSGWFVFVLGYVGSLFVVTSNVAAGTNSVGDIVLTVVVASTLQGAVAAAITSVGSAFSANRVIGPFKWLNSRAERDHQLHDADASPPARLSTGISLRDVRFRYPGTTREILSGIDLDIAPNTVVAIVGEYGSGKTTLIKLLARFYDPTSGVIEVDGEDIAAFGPAVWRERTSAAYQDFGKFLVPMRESVGLGDVRRIDDDAAVSAALADAADIVRSLPRGIDTQLGTELGGVDLSEGQWQRVALARAAMRNKPSFYPWTSRRHR